MWDEQAQRGMVDIGPMLSASILRSLTLATWLYDFTYLQQLPSTLEVRTRGDALPQPKPCPEQRVWTRVGVDDMNGQQLICGRRDGAPSKCRPLWTQSSNANQSDA